MNTHRTYIIGITGGIGSGKSTIARELLSRGYIVYDCDREAKNIIFNDNNVRQAIIDLLGSDAFCGAQYNTAFVSQRVFNNPHLLAQLNAIIHPAVKRDILYRQAQMTVPFFFIESAILYESGFDTLCQQVFLIDAPEELRLKRTLARDYHSQITEENINKVRARMGAQLQQSVTKSHKKPIALINDGSLSISELADKICSHLI
jgi:dephospho-CoA kinase